MHINIKNIDRTFIGSTDLNKAITKSLRNINWDRLAKIQADRSNTTIGDIKEGRLIKYHLAANLHGLINDFFEAVQTNTTDPNNSNHRIMVDIMKHINILADGDTIEYNHAFKIASIKSMPSFVIIKKDTNERICVDLVPSNDTFKKEIKSAFYSKFNNTSYAYYDEATKSLVTDIRKADDKLQTVMKGDLLFNSEEEYI